MAKNKQLRRNFSATVLLADGSEQFVQNRFGGDDEGVLPDNLAAGQLERLESLGAFEPEPVLTKGEVLAAAQEALNALPNDVDDEGDIVPEPAAPKAAGATKKA